MARDVWAEMAPCLKPSLVKDFVALVDCQSDLASNVRHLYFKSMDESDEVDERLKSLIATIPENQLRPFTCDIALSNSSLRLLFERQHGSDASDVLDFMGLFNAGQNDCVYAAMASIKYQAITAPMRDATNAARKYRHYRSCRQIINSLSKLKALRLKDDEQSHENLEGVDI